MATRRGASLRFPPAVPVDCVIAPSLCKRSEASLQESEKHFRAIVESSPIPLLITRLDDGTVLYANSQ